MPHDLAHVFPSNVLGAKKSIMSVRFTIKRCSYWRMLSESLTHHRCLISEYNSLILAEGSSGQVRIVIFVFFSDLHWIHHKNALCNFYFTTVQFNLWQYPSYSNLLPKLRAGLLIPANSLSWAPFLIISTYYCFVLYIYLLGGGWGGVLSSFYRKVTLSYSFMKHPEQEFNAHWR